MSVIAFLQEIKSACDACEADEDAAVWLLKQLWRIPDEKAVKAWVTVTSSAISHDEGAIKSYCTSLQFFLKFYVTDENIAKVDAEVRSLRRGWSKQAEYAQAL